MLSAAAVFVLLKQVSARDLWLNLRRADPGWLLAACLLTTVVYWIRAWRWGEILSPVARVPGGRLFATTMVGFLAINTLPARLGELVRAYALARSERIKTGTVLGSVVIERIFDLAALIGFWNGSRLPGLGNFTDACAMGVAVSAGAGCAGAAVSAGDAGFLAASVAACTAALAQDAGPSHR